MSRLHLARPSRPTLLAGVALAVALGGQNAYAAATNFLLNTSNTSTAQTTLNGSAVAGRALQITNTNTAAGATALGLNVASGHPPFAVNSATKVTNLNADKLDGLDSTQLQRRVTGTCPGAAMSAVTVTGSATCTDFPRVQALTTGDDVGSFPYANSVGVFTNGTGAMFIYFDASGFRATPNGSIGAQLVYCDTTPCSGDNVLGVFAQAEVFSNEANSHKSMVTGYGVWVVPPGTHYLNVIPTPGTIMDFNDHVHFVIYQQS
jgi:hypothetical protein